MNITGDNRPEQWRYRFENGRWWYWTPQNHWMWYGDNGWVNYDSAIPYTTGYGSYEVPSGGYVYPNYGTYYYPGYGYFYPRWYGGRYYNRPGVYVGVGGIGVGVGFGRYGGYRR